jgi:AMMECR1 domain-containing protein
MQERFPTLTEDELRDVVAGTSILEELQEKIAYHRERIFGHRAAATNRPVDRATAR